MPNWCLTNYKIVGPKEDIRRFNDMLDDLSALPEPRVENGFGKLWLGCLVDYLGGDWHDIYCRGEVCDRDTDMAGEMITLTVMSAWAEQAQTRSFLQEKFPKCQFYYISEEPGNGYYIKNDAENEFFPENFVLQYSVEEGSFDVEYFEDIRDIPPYLKENIGIKCKPDKDSVMKALDRWNAKNRAEGRFAYLNEFQLVDHGGYTVT